MDNYGNQATTKAVFVLKELSTQERRNNLKEKQLLKEEEKITARENSHNRCIFHEKMNPSKQTAWLVLRAPCPSTVEEILTDKLLQKLEVSVTRADFQDDGIIRCVREERCIEQPLAKD